MGVARRRHPKALRLSRNIPYIAIVVDSIVDNNTIIGQGLTHRIRKHTHIYIYASVSAIIKLLETFTTGKDNPVPNKHQTNIRNLQSYVSPLLHGDFGQI